MRNLGFTVVGHQPVNSHSAEPIVAGLFVALLIVGLALLARGAKRSPAVLGATAALLLVTLFLGLGPERVHAQEPTEEEPPAEYMELIQDAVTESAAQRWVEAHGLFREAQQVFPNARALRGIGMTAFELRDYVGAYLGLSAALAETRRALDFEQRAQVEALLRRVNGLIARYTVAHLGEAATVLSSASR